MTHSLPKRPMPLFFSPPKGLLGLSILLYTFSLNLRHSSVETLSKLDPSSLSQPSPSPSSPSPSSPSPSSLSPSSLSPSSLVPSVVILDFGAQYTQLIARRIREQNVFSVVLPCTASLDEVKSYAP